MITIQEVKTNAENFSEYRELTPAIFDRSAGLSKQLKKLKVIHINSTQLGGGVSELLRSQMPLERSLGIDSYWYIIKAPRQFFKVTKKIHNMLQGEDDNLNLAERFFFMEWLRSAIAPFFRNLIKKEKPDIVLIHDPQPLPLIDHIVNKSKDVAALLRLHIDLSEPNEGAMNFLQPFIEKYQLTILSHQSYKPKWLKDKDTSIIMPAIDPFTPKNVFMDEAEADKTLGSFKIKTDKPIVSQVSRFDPWKDPLGTLKAYQLAKAKHPDLQLILAGLFQAYDDPEAIEVFEKVQKEAADDKDVFLFSDPSALNGISNDVFINSVYSGSDIIIQKSIKEGFGLTVTEAMWKKKPVIGGKAKGIMLQIEHNQNGLLAGSPKEAGQHLIYLLENKEEAQRLGLAAHQSVKDKFLMSRLVLEHLEVYSKFK